MKKIYVDTENISNYNFLKKMCLNSDDEIILFLSHRSNNMNSFNLEILLNSMANKKTVFVNSNEKNAMDFQIVAYLGVLYTKEDTHYIISNDKGYNAAINCFKEQFNYTNIQLLTEDAIVFSEEDSDLDKIIKKEAVPIIESIEQSYGIEKKKVFDLIRKAGEFRNLHNCLVKEYGEEGKKMYQTFKKVYKLCFVM